MSMKQNYWKKILLRARKKTDKYALSKQTNAVIEKVIENIPKYLSRKFPEKLQLKHEKKR